MRGKSGLEYGLDALAGVCWQSRPFLHSSMAEMAWRMILVEDGLEVQGDATRRNATLRGSLQEYLDHAFWAFTTPQTPQSSIISTRENR